MLDKLKEVEQSALASLKDVSSEVELNNWRITHLGRNSALKKILNTLGTLPKEEARVIGKHGNDIEKALNGAYQRKTEDLSRASLDLAMSAEPLDVTLPGRPVIRGRLHPATQTLRQIYAIWAEMGFQVYRSRDVETDQRNFELLNIPAYHPARDMWSTFYTTQENVLLRTHTSPGQIHAMREYCPQPIRVILPGMCYRHEKITARSEIQFHQVEGLAVGKHVTLTDLKGTLSDFARQMFGPSVRTRFRASYFPFTEPSAEMDIECFVCGGGGCSVCKHTGWLEILGCGMVHPQVLENGGYDPHIYSGFAFGMGPERITMLKHRIEDIRYFWANDLRFLEQF
jgi:phenylalanyl-tRNA synthetase alpha chain